MLPVRDLGPLLDPRAGWSFPRSHRRRSEGLPIQDEVLCVELGPLQDDAHGRDDGHQVAAHGGFACRTLLRAVVLKLRRSRQLGVEELTLGEPVAAKRTERFLT